MKIKSYILILGFSGLCLKCNIFLQGSARAKLNQEASVHKLLLLLLLLFRSSKQNKHAYVPFYGFQAQSQYRTVINKTTPRLHSVCRPLLSQCTTSATIKCNTVITHAHLYSHCTDLSCIVTLTTAALSHWQSASVGTSHDSCSAQSSSQSNHRTSPTKL